MWIAANNFINKLREKPEPLRRQIVVWTAAAVTVIIFFIWLGSLSPRVRTAPEVQAITKAEQAPGPLTIFTGFLIAEVKQILNGGKVFYGKIR